MVLHGGPEWTWSKLDVGGTLKLDTTWTEVTVEGVFFW